MKTLLRVARTTTALASCSLPFAACGGGGGGASVTPGSGPASAPPIAKSVARSDAQAMLSAAQSSSFFAGGQSTLGTARKVLARRMHFPANTVTITFGT